MKYIKIVVVFFIFNLSNANTFRIATDSILYTKIELRNKYTSLHYKLLYEKEHAYKNIKNQFFVFSKLDNKLGIESHRVLITCQKIKGKFKILDINDAIIYNKNYSTDVNDSFSKIAVKGLYITLEEFSPTKYQNEIVHEFITFKYDVANTKYYLEKYSVIVEHINVDESDVQTLTKDDFGKIELKDFYFGILDSTRKKFETDIFEKLVPNTYWIEKHDKK